jgi:hypothetical protein
LVPQAIANRRRSKSCPAQKVATTFIGHTPALLQLRLWNKAVAIWFPAHLLEFRLH